ncbi:hypothetical protein HY065_01220 [Candidatus Berkelbacteria bacterium]|nr:hypothetical protein [Candidatus Berkelbacteria bacterium]
MRLLRGYAGLLFIIIVFLGFTFWVGSLLNSGALQHAGPSSPSQSAPPTAEVATPPATVRAPAAPPSWVSKAFKPLNLKFDVLDNWTQTADETPGARFVNPTNSKQLLGVRLHPKNSEAVVRASIIVAKESPVVVSGQPATQLVAKRKNNEGSLDMLLVKQFSALYEFYGQDVDFSHIVKSIAFVSGDLPAVKSYKTTGCNVTLEYPDAWSSKEIFGPPGAATIIGFDPKPIPDSGETSGKLQVSCLTGNQESHQRDNFVAFHKEVKQDKITVGQFEALELTGMVPADAPAAAGERRRQVIFEKGDRTYMMSYTSPQDSFDKDLVGLNIILDTIEVQ